MIALVITVGLMNGYLKNATSERYAQTKTFAVLSVGNNI